MKGLNSWLLVVLQYGNEISIAFEVMFHLFAVNLFHYHQVKPIQTIC